MQGGEVDSALVLQLSTQSYKKDLVCPKNCV